MLSKKNQAKFLPTPELMDVYLKDEQYINSFNVLDRNVFFELKSLITPKEKRSEIQAEFDTKMPEYMMYLWSKKFSDDVCLRINLDCYAQGNFDKKFTIYAKNNGYNKDTDFFDVKYSKKLQSEVLMVKTAEGYDLLYSAVYGYNDFFSRERERCFKNEVYGMGVYEELAPIPVQSLFVIKDVCSNQLKEYDLCPMKKGTSK